MRGRDGAPPAAEPVEGEEAAIAVSGMVNEVGERSEGLATEDIRLLEEILMRWPPPRTTLLVKCLRQKSISNYSIVSLPIFLSLEKNLFRKTLKRDV